VDILFLSRCERHHGRRCVQNSPTCMYMRLQIFQRRDLCLRSLTFFFPPQHNFEPGQKQVKSFRASSENRKKSQESLLKASVSLFERVPILGSLCVEVLTCQCVSSIINFLFVLKVKQYVPDDQERARWTGMVSSSYVDTIFLENIGSRCTSLLRKPVLCVDQCFLWTLAICRITLFGEPCQRSSHMVGDALLNGVVCNAYEL
jgi:hypothetical protein